MKQKMIFQSPPSKKNLEDDKPQIISGPICRINPGEKKGDAIVKGGALTSAFLSAFLWNINIVLASVGLGSVAVGNLLAKYRFYFISVTVTLLAMSFYKTYRGNCYVPKRNKIILWVTAALSLSLTLYSIFKRPL